MSRTLIIGNGMAAGKLVQELVHLGSRDDIVVAGLEGPGIYNRILLTPYLTQTHLHGGDFWLLDEAWFRKHNVTMLPQHRAVDIDRSARTVSFENGRVEAYDNLVLALGSKPFFPPIKGIDLSGVHALRTMADGDKIRVRLDSPQHLLVIGGGLIGLETALELYAAGHTVTVAHNTACLMERHLDPTAAAYLRKHLESSGMKVMTQALCSELQGEDGRVTRAVFQSGEVVETDLVLVSTGVLPVTDLAKTVGLEVGRGIRVDDRLQTSDPSIYAVGECLEWKGRLWGLVSSTFEQSRTLAQVLTGKPGSYQPSDHPPTRLKAPVFAASLGALDTGEGDEVFEFKDPVHGVYKKVVIRNGKVHGAQAVGSLGEDDLERWDAIEVAYSSGRPLDASPGSVLFSPLKMDATAARTWPDNLRVCNCNGVSAGDIREAIAQGCLTPEAVMKVTRAGTGCSTCRGRLRSLVEAEAGATPKKEGRWKKMRRAYREKEVRGFTPYWIVSYAIDYLLLFCAAVVLVTGIVKFPGFLAWLFVSVHDLFPDLHLSVRKLTLDAEKLKDFLSWWHDWTGLAMTGGVFLHLVIHWGMMVSFLRSMVHRRKVPLE